MPVSVTMPRLGESVTEGTIIRWLKQEGDRVEADEPLLEVSTDKVDTEIPAPAAGVLSRIVVHEDETAEVGSELAIIAGDGESGDDGSASADADAVANAGAHARAETAQPTPAHAGSTDAAAGATDATAGSAQPSDAQADTADAAEATDAQRGSARPTDTQAGSADATGVQAHAAAERDAQGSPDTGASAGSPAPTSTDGPRADGSGGGSNISVPMPALGESVTEGTVIRWLKAVGDQVEADEPLLEVSTDKVDTEIPAPAAGTLLEIKVGEDETVAVGAELAVIGGTDGSTGSAAAGSGTPTQGAAPPQAAAPQAAAPQAAAPQGVAPSQPDGSARTGGSAQTAAPTQPAASVESAPAPEAGAGTTARPAVNGEDFEGYVTPLVRRLAGEQGVDLSRLSGTGIGGRIRKQDVIDAADRQRAEAASAAQSRTAAQPAAAQSAPGTKPQPSPLRGRTEKLTRIRTITAKRLVESLQISAQLTTVVEVDVTRIARLRQRAKARFEQVHGAKLTFLPFFAVATVEALRVHPEVNASIDLDAGTVTYHDAEHLGIAVDTEKGLIVPVIQNAGDLNLAGLAKRIADLAQRARSNKLTPDDLSGGTFTLTNTGSRGALFDTPIINQPQVGILGTGAVVKRAVVVSDPDLGEIVAPRSMVYLALSYDHRQVDGADAARFLTTIKERLEAGNFEAELGLSGT
ncbi:MAG: hypothetical protein QOE03_3659 [Micromonosporaceae bacterium]|nr:hypothetical protein [Micromonosporaceae bacterium]